MKRHQRDLEVISDLNLTNMLDTAFVLLLVFIMVAPVLKQGINIELPEVAEGPVETSNKTFSIQIAPGKDGITSDRIYLPAMEQYVTVQELQGIVEIERGGAEKFDVVIEADKSVKYDTFAQVLALLKNMGIENVGLITEPREIRGK